MSTQTVNTILARCILDPTFLNQVANNTSSVLKLYRLDENTISDFYKLDLGRIEKFAGFITKVQNNFLWDSLPYTRALLKYYKIEIEIFTAYRQNHQCLRANGQTSRSKKTEEFIKFLEEYLRSINTVEYVGLADILLHEKLQWVIRNNLSSKDVQFDESYEVDDVSLTNFNLWRLRPVVRGLLHIGYFSRDPFIIISHLNQKTFSPQNIPDQSRNIGYWGDTSAQEIRLLDLNYETSVLLAQVNSLRTMQTIINRVRKIYKFKLNISDVREFIQTATKSGLLLLMPMRPSGRRL